MRRLIEIQWTSPAIEEARSIISILLERHLIACAHILPWIESHFFWEGALQKESEVKVLLKTAEPLFEKVKQIIEAESSYEIPCIIYQIFDGGNGSYLEWVDQNVQP